MAIAGLDESVSSFAVHPDYRQVSTFFLGGVFVTSLHCLLASSLVQRFLGFIRGRPALDAERSFVSDKLSARSLDADNRSEARHGYSTTAFFALPLCFLFASVAQFASLLAFPLSADAACAFVVAWGRIPVCAARLIGALIVVFELRKMGVARWEFWVAIVCLIIGIGFIFLNNAIGVGVLTTFAPLNVAYCDRKHFLPASLVSSVLYFSLEVYAIARMILIISSEVNMRKVIVDARVLRPLSLVFLELLTLVPSAVFTNVVAEFVPFSIGAVVVLLTFKVGPASRAAVSSRGSMLSYATYPSVQSIRQSAPYAAPSPTLQPPSPVLPAPTRRHPFAATDVYRPEEEYIPPSARTTRSIDTAAAHSISGAVVRVGQRARAASRGADATHPAQQPPTAHLESRIVASQTAFAEKLDLEHARANSLSARPRPIITTPVKGSTLQEEDDMSDLISPASHLMPPVGFRLSSFGQGRGSLRRTSYRTSFIPESVASGSSEDSVVRTQLPIPLYDSRSVSSDEQRRRSTSLSLTQESSTDHRRTLSASNPLPQRWPTFNAGQFRATGFVGAESVVDSPSRPPPLPLKPTSPPGAPRGPRPPPSAQSSRSNM